MRLIVLPLVLMLATSSFSQELPADIKPRKHHNPFHVLYAFHEHPKRTESIWMIGGGLIGFFVFRQVDCKEKFYFDNGVKEPYSGKNVPCPKNTYGP